MRVLIIGNGAKELALMQHLMEKGGHDVLIVPGNPGCHGFAQAIGSDLSALDAQDILKTARSFHPDEILVLDECFAMEPVVQELREQGFSLLCPTLPAASMLHDKEKWIQFLQKNGWNVPDFAICHSYDEALQIVQETPGPWVLTKLTKPEGFSVCYLEEEADDLLSEWFSLENTDVMITDYIDGNRFYECCIVWNDRVLPLQTAYIQRGIYEDEDDPETKGMGAFAPADNIPMQDKMFALENILMPFLKKMNEEGIPYQGFLAGEFVTTDEEPVCVNLKCGVSDCASILTFIRLQSDLMEELQKLKDGSPISLKWYPGSAASVVLAACEYPKAPSIGVPIQKDDDFEGLFFPHRTKIENNHLVTNGGRVLMVAALGSDRQEAAAQALEAADHVSCEDLFYRTDIGRVNEAS